MNALKGVGDETRGPIPDERTSHAYHVRRRLSVKEEALIPNGACDVRRTAEAERRWQKALRWLRPDFYGMALEEMASA